MKKRRTFFSRIIGIFLLIVLTHSAYAIHLPYPKNVIQLGYYNRGFIDCDCPRPPNPIFWKATTKVKSGVQFDYQRLVFDNGGRFGVFIGADVSRYTSVDTHSFYAETVYPAIRYWFIRTQKADLYFEYSVAGPTILSRRVIGQESGGGIREKDMGGYIIFQDFLGLGATLGRGRFALNLNVRLVHYSNGDILPQNPGFDVPIVVYLGLSF